MFGLQTQLEQNQLDQINESKHFESSLISMETQNRLLKEAILVRN